MSLMMIITSAIERTTLRTKSKSQANRNQDNDGSNNNTNYYNNTDMMILHILL